MLRFLFFIGVFCSLYGSPCYAQERPLSSQELYHLILDHTRFNPEKAVYYANELLDLSTARNQKDSMALAYLYLGKAGRIQGDFDTAIAQIDAGIKLAQEENLATTILAELFLAKANNLADNNQIESAIPIMFEGLSYAKASKNLVTQVALNHGLGYIYFAAQNFKKSKEVILDNLKIIEEESLTDKKSFEVYYKGLIMLANNYSSENKKDSAIYYLNKGLKAILTTDDIFTTSGYYNMLGEIYLHEKNYEKAYENLIEAKKYGDQLGNHFIVADNQLNLARYYFETSAYAKSIEELSNILHYHQKNDLEDFISPEVYKLLAENYQQTNAIEKANTYLKLYVLKYQNAVAGSIAVNSIVQDIELADLQVEKEKKEGFVYYLIGLVLVLGIGLIILLFLLRQRKTKNEDKFQAVLQKLNQLKKVETPEALSSSSVKTQASTEVSEEITTQILSGLKKLNEQLYFLQQECNSYNVAKKIKTNTSYLSKVINTHFDKNFNNYINDLRIDHALVRLEGDKTFRLFSIQSIAEELGYKSADSFTKYFKSRTGLNPSFYIKQLNARS